MIVRRRAFPLYDVSRLQSVGSSSSLRGCFHTVEPTAGSRLQSLILASQRAHPSLLSHRSLHTSQCLLSRPSISSNGQTQPPAYLEALETLYADIASRHPDGRRKSGQEAVAFPPWPTRREMHHAFNVSASRGRCSLVSFDKAREVVRGALDLDLDSNRKEGRVVIEAFPGPGAVTRALLELPRSEVKRVIVLEEELKYLKFLKELEYYDDRVHVLPHSAFIWETYDEIRDLGLLDDVVAEDWKSGPVGEQLIAQLFRAIPEQSWLFKYGRRVQSPPKKSSRCKLTVIAEATAKLSPAIPERELQDYNKLFFPKSDSSPVGSRTPLARRIGQPFVALNVDPLAECHIMLRAEANELIARAVINTTHSKTPVNSAEKAGVERIIDEGGVKEVISAADAKGLIMGADKGEVVEGFERVLVPAKEGTRVTLEKWDYVVRQLFILKSTPLEKAIQNLGAGAAILLSKLTGPDIPEERRVNIKTPINALSVQDFARIVEEFDRWPFAPDVLFLADPSDEDRN
ncbi:Mitochondrial transcription factor 1 [Ceratobasidium sp. 395]|nr:Mitochondrial transcription factor 1 [Ceratobasidium sp. 395]